MQARTLARRPRGGASPSGASPAQTQTLTCHRCTTATRCPSLHPERRLPGRRGARPPLVRRAAGRLACRCCFQWRLSVAPDRRPASVEQAGGFATARKPAPAPRFRYALHALPCPRAGPRSTHTVMRLHVCADAVCAQRTSERACALTLSHAGRRRAAQALSRRGRPAHRHETTHARACAPHTYLHMLCSRPDLPLTRAGRWLCALQTGASIPSAHPSLHTGSASRTAPHRTLPPLNCTPTAGPLGPRSAPRAHPGLCGGRSLSPLQRPPEPNR